MGKAIAAIALLGLASCATVPPPTKGLVDPRDDDLVLYLKNDFLRTVFTVIVEVDSDPPALVFGSAVEERSRLVVPHAARAGAKRVRVYVEAFSMGRPVIESRVFSGAQIEGAKAILIGHRFSDVLGRRSVVIGTSKGSADADSSADASASQ